MQDHPLRAALNAELHARPHLRITAPAALSHVVLVAEEGGAEADRDAFAAFCRAHGAADPPPGARHHIVPIAGRVVRWERHGEFQSFTVLTDAEPDAGQESDEGQPPDRAWSATHPEAEAFLETVRGQRLSALHLRILPGAATVPPPGAFAGEVVGGALGHGDAMAFTDFRVADDGFVRMVLYANRLTPGRLGRMAQRLMEIEHYRMAALLGLPMAREATPRLAALERSLDATVAATAAPAPDDAKLLDQLTKLAAEAEALAASSRFRFSATDAYGALVAARIEELNEDRLESVQRMGVFLDRRFTPALRTCAAVSRRKRALTEGIARAGGMLRTRVEVGLEGQNRDLLAAMDKRAAAQLRLSQAVEGLSTFAIAYYAVSLMKIAVDGLPALGLPDAPKWASVIAVPAIAAAIWFGVRKLRRSLAGSDAA
ncbi:DUF3422 family protein [Elioraea sp.]|uniref:DUF3422 family protein n=1 Tax=Elioraea sp. TaxID=2185103 RepID=UPI0025C63EEE|nr:DUF3422 domain-containing protein [Elioraea sp.]